MLILVYFKTVIPHLRLQVIQDSVLMQHRNPQLTLHLY